MRFLIFFAAFLGATFAAYMPIEGMQKEHKIADKQFLVKQKNILKLLNHVSMLNSHQDQVQIGKEYNIAANIHMYSKPEAVKDFVHFWQSGMLPRNKIFSIMYEKQRMEAIALFHVFYYAKDFDTFYRTACWARDHVNEGMFVYALTVAVLHRHDCMGIILPAPYEIYPYYFLNSEVIQKGYRLKMQERVMDPKLAEFYGITMVDNNVFVVNANYSGWYMTTNEEQKMSYFTEDIGLNSYYFYFHADYPFWMGGDQFGLNKDRRGEMWFYVHQQLLARYYLERLSNNLGEIPRFSWNWPIKTGFTPSLTYANGLEFPARPNNFDLHTEDNLWDLIDVKDLERRIRDAITQGYVITEEGSHISLKKAEDIELLGRLMQPNSDNPNQRFYYYVSMIAKSLLGNSVEPINDYYTAPSVLEQFETALRDPIFYQLYQRLMHYFIQFKEMLPAYTREEVNFQGVRIEDVQVDKLVTFFDYFNVDMTNAMYRKGDEFNQNKEQFVFLAKQMRLNHQPFDIKINVMSEKATDAVVRIFLGPKYDSMGRTINIDDNRVNFFEMDSFLFPLQTGKNVIVRNSREFLYMVQDRIMTRDLLKKVDTCLNTNEQFTLDMTQAHMGWPLRLLLPKGKIGGMPFQFFVVISRHVQPKVSKGTGYDMNISGGVGTGARFFDGNALGYPLDRPIDETQFYTKNMYMKDVLIYHKSKYNTVDQTRVTGYEGQFVDNVNQHVIQGDNFDTMTEYDSERFMKY